MAVLSPEQEASVRTQFAPASGQAAEAKPAAAEGKVELPPTLSVKELAEYLDVKTVDIIKELMKNGVMANINQQIDFDTAAIVADSFGVQASPMAMDSAIAEEIVGEGEGTFYGPKIDLHVTDSLGRSWQLATIQLDYYMPKQFGNRWGGARKPQTAPAGGYRHGPRRPRQDLVARRRPPDQGRGR